MRAEPGAPPGPSVAPTGVRQHPWGHLRAAAGMGLPGLAEAEPPLGKRLVYVCQTVKRVTGNSEAMEPEDIFASLRPWAGVEKRRGCGLVLPQMFASTLCASVSP